MNRKLMLLASAAAGALALATPAQAGQFNGWYVGIEAGASWVQDFDFVEGTAPVTPPTTHTHFANVEFDTGWAVMATVGYGWNNWRFEFEAGYRANDYDQINTLSITPGTTLASSWNPNGELKEITLMANVLYDIQLANKWSVSIGGGIGADHLDFDSFNTGPDHDEWRLAAQGIAGLNYAIGQRSALFLNYRYLWVDAPEFDVGPIYGELLVGNEDDLAKHAVTIGFRFDLSPGYVEPVAPPPVPPAPPAPPPPTVKSFIVFFGFNKCNITAEADRVLAEAASTAKSEGSAAVKVVGHTDTVGSHAYNQKLSLCRANAAREGLIAHGVPDGAIATAGAGETELLVQTADGVKEPQNRRATIDID